MNYPAAGRPIEGATAKAVPCVACGADLAIGRWDRWNGFLVECWSCHKLHGKARSLKNVALAGLFFNILSFWFLMRPRKALLWTVVFVGLVLGGGLFLPSKPPDSLLLLLAGTALLGPVAAAVIAGVSHQTRLLQPAPNPRSRLDSM
ncbi:MAG: hypothetical protein AAGC60_14650 [Acidobacteriota bacterium]